MSSVKPPAVKSYQTIRLICFLWMSASCARLKHECRSARLTASHAPGMSVLAGAAAQHFQPIRNNPVRSFARARIEVAPQPPQEVVRHVDVGGLRTLAQVTSRHGRAILLPGGF